MTNTNPSYDCPVCGEPALVDTSTNFKREWGCGFCEATFSKDEIEKITGLP